MKLVHAADLHLDSPLLGLDRYDGAPAHRLRNATREALENLVALCIEEEASLLLLAGDLYDGGWKDYSTGLFFAAQMSRLRHAGVQVAWIRGNHDAASQLTRHLELPDNVRELPHRRPGTELFRFPEQDVAVHGQGFASRDVTDDLTAAYPEPVPGAFNVGLLHTALTGRAGHDRYAPCTVEDLRAKGYDYWALGHVHQREVLCEDPWIVFAGNLQGRHARETGEKGATLLSVESGKVVAVEHRALDVVRWVVAEVDVGACEVPGEVLALVEARLRSELELAGGRLLAVRVVVTGATGAHAALSRDRERWTSQIRAMATDISPDDIWVEKARIATGGRASAQELIGSDDAISEVFRGISELRASDETLLATAAELADLGRKLPLPLREGPEALRLDDPVELRAILDDVEAMLLARLLGSGA